MTSPRKSPFAAPALLALTLLISALLTGCPATHTVRQSTLFGVPSAGLPQTSHGRADLTVAGSGTTYIETYSREPSEESGQWLARGQLDGQAAVRISRFVAVRAAGFVAFGQGAIAPEPTALETPRDPAWGVGPIASLGYAAEDEPAFGRIEAGTLFSFFPSVLLVRETGVITPCPCPIVREEHTSFMPIFHGAVSFGYWVLPELALSAGVVFRNQPRSSNQGSFDTRDSASAQISFGDLTAIPWAAAEVEIAHGVGLVAQMQLPILDRVFFGPTLTLGLRALIAHGPSSTRRRPPPRE